MSEQIDRIMDEQRKHDATRQLLVNAMQIARSERVQEMPIGGRQVGAAPRWPSGIKKLDEEYGGFYGLTVVGGSEGSGKSTLALGSSLLAAEAGWCVCYFDAENGRRLVQDRFWRWFGATEAQLAAERLAGYWHRFEVLPGATLEDLVEQTLHAFSLRHQGVLLVLDSLSTIAEFDAKTSQESFDSMRRLLFWLDTLVRRSASLVPISALALSELNASGELKGRKAAYTANMAVRIMPEDDDNEIVRVKITKSRDGKAGDLGLFVRNWRTSRFETPRSAHEVEREVRF